MAASDHLNKTLFHGTAGEVSGGVVRPTETLFGYGAYATTRRSMAELRARQKSKQQGTLFGTVYEVTPESDLEQVSDKGYETYRDLQGLKVQKAVSYPISEDLYKPPLLGKGGKVLIPEYQWGTDK